MLMPQRFNRLCCIAHALWQNIDERQHFVDQNQIQQYFSAHLKAFVQATTMNFRPAGMILLRSSCVRSVNFTYVFLTVFINVAPMQQYCSTVNKNAFTHLDAKHSATLQKLRDVAQALAVGLGILEDLRRRADGKRLHLSFALFNVFNLGELTKCTKIHGLTVAHCVHNHTHTLGYSALWK